MFLVPQVHALCKDTYIQANVTDCGNIDGHIGKHYIPIFKIQNIFTNAGFTVAWRVPFAMMRTPSILHKSLGLFQLAVLDFNFFYKSYSLANYQSDGANELC